jgi:hypothetical protein
MELNMIESKRLSWVHINEIVSYWSKHLFQTHPGQKCILATKGRHPRVELPAAYLHTHKATLLSSDERLTHTKWQKLAPRGVRATVSQDDMDLDLVVQVTCPPAPGEDFTFATTETDAAFLLLAHLPGTHATTPLH